MVGDYGSFQILAAPAAAGAPLVAAGTAGWVDEFDVIELNAGPLRTTQADVQALRQPLPAFGGKRLHLLQFAGPVKPAWHSDLVACGVQVVAYVPNNAYLIYGDALALGLVQAWSAIAGEVQWEAAYLEAYKLHPDVRLQDAKGAPRQLKGDLFALQMVADAEANAATLAAINAWRLAPLLKQETALNYLNVIVRLPAEALAELAKQPDVVSIWPYVMPKKRDERQGQIVAGNLTGTQPTGPGYLEWLASKGFTQAQFAASGFAVDVSDSGLDNGTATPGHFGLYEGGNTGSVSRVAYNRLVGTPHTGSTIQGCDGHGTLNAHIVGGYNDFSGFPYKDSAGFSYGLGIAPFVRVGSSVIFDPDSFTSPNFANLQSQAYYDGARISANSWGANTSGGYNTDAQSYDALVRDAQPDTALFPEVGNQEMVIVFAAGNAGPGTGSVGAPGTAKNVITVGAAENVHSHSTANGGNNLSGNDGCDDTDVMADSAADMSDYSSRGPCADGRKKPDLVAPGTHVTGGVAQIATPSATGTALACFDGTGVCALPGSGTAGDPDNFFPLGQQFYTTSAGTSHSTPAVAGGAALVRQWFINQSLTPPSPALTKAWLLNTARYMTGTYANDTLPSSVQGLGCMHFGMAFDDAARIVMEQSPTEKFTASGQTRAIVGRITDSSKPFRVTLAWTDAPGSTTGSAYNNNLDLTLTVGGQTYRGNVFNGAFSVAGGSADARNNVESIFLPAGTTGNFVATITAANIAFDGVPNDAEALDQDFALVVYNAETREAPVISADGASLTAENCAPGNNAADPGETVSVSFSLKNIGTGSSTNLIATLLPIGGVLAPSAPQSYGVLNPGDPSVPQTFSFQAVGLCGSYITCTLQLTDGGSDLGIVSVPLRLGSPNTASTSADDPTVITIPTQGAASPYPASVTITGMAGTISKAVVTVHGFNHAYPSDSDLLLVGPSGQTVLLMSSVGGGTDATEAELTFDDNAASSVPAPIVSGTYRPTFSGTVTLPAPAPARPYGTTLSALNGTSPNGTWQLYANDHAASDSGSISGGWSLAITTEDVACCFNSSQADLSLSIQAQPNPVAWEANVTYSITVSNGGPALAAGVVVSNLLPEQVSYDSGSSSSGTVTHDSGVVLATLGDLASGSVATVDIVGVVNYGSGLTNLVTVGMTTFDFDPANNAAMALTTVTEPVLNISSQVYLTTESCGGGNGAVDPEEQVTVNLVLQNIGTRKTTNVTVSLLPTGGVASPSGTQNYGAMLPGGPPVTNSFSFVAQGLCGSLLTATFDVADSAAPLLVLSNNFRVGVPIALQAENFDGVTEPDLPAGWTTALTGAGPTWATVSTLADSLPNAVFVADPTTTSDKQLISPAVLVTAPAQLRFRHSYGTESCCDGGKLEISINGGTFADIVAAGGSFAAGGYGTGNWWAGNSGGFITTVANLPAAALGQSVRFRWHFTSDTSVGGTGWYVDSIMLLAGYECCLADDLALGGSASPSQVVVGENLTYTFGVTNSGPGTAAGVTISNFLPAGVSFVSAAASQGTWSRNGDVVVASLGNVAGSSGAGLSIVVKAMAAGSLTNLAIVQRNGTESYLVNNSVQTIIPSVLPTTNYTFSSATLITIPATGAGSPYPDTLVVSGIAGTVSKVTATLNGLSHTYPDDIDILLVGPGGQQTMLMSDCGGSPDLVDVTLTFDDAAFSLVPDATAIGSGTYRPTDSATGDVLPTPAPAGPYGTSLAAYAGISPNGTWELYINDDTSGDAGSLAGGWSLTLTVTLPPPMILRAAMHDAATVALTFDSQTGSTYIMEYKKSLADDSWNDMPPVSGTGSPITVLDNLAGETQRIYRVRIQ